MNTSHKTQENRTLHPGVLVHYCYVSSGKTNALRVVHSNTLAIDSATEYENPIRFR